MHELLKKFWKENDANYLLQPMTAFFSNWEVFRENEESKPDYHIAKAFEKYEATGIKGFIFENHIGLQRVKDIAGEGLYVYGMRHGDDWCEPADIENREVVVNFYAYFVTDQPLDDLFSDERDWHEIYDWAMDWGDEYYWED